MLSRTERARASRSWATSPSLPTSGVSRRLANAGAPGLSSTRRQTTVSPLPAASSSTRIASSASCREKSATAISPAATCSARRVDLTTTSAPSSSCPGWTRSPSTISPVKTPARSSSRARQVLSSSSTSAGSPSRASTAARSARSASSSCRIGTPKTPTSVSPVSPASVPPWRSTTAETASTERARTRASPSGSRGPPAAEECARTKATVVTVFRTSRAGPPATSTAVSEDGGSSAGSWRRMSPSRRWSSGPGSIPSSSTSTCRASRYAASASAWRPARYRASIELPAEALAQRMGGDESFEVADEVLLRPGGEREVEPCLERDEAELLEAGDLALRERFVAQVGERRAAPERERLVDKRSGGRRVADRALVPCTGEQILETVAVEAPGRHVEHVAGRLRRQVRARATEDLAEPGYVPLERRLRSLRRLLAPELRRSGGRSRPPRCDGGGGWRERRAAVPHRGRAARFRPTPRAAPESGTPLSARLRVHAASRALAVR